MSQDGINSQLMNEFMLWLGSRITEYQVKQAHSAMQLYSHNGRKMDCQRQSVTRRHRFKGKAFLESPPRA